MRERVGMGTAELLHDLDLPGARLLLVNGTPQSYVDLDDPTHLEFEYVRRLGHVVDAMAPRLEPLRVVHLGGGALTLPRYVAATRPGSAQIVVEADGELVELVRRELPLDPADRPRVRVGDARELLTAMPDGRADLVVLDVFAGARTPAHLTSVEFVREAARVLRPDGLYAANVADGAPLAFARGQVAAMLDVFGHGCVIAAPAVLRGRRFGNLVLVGGDQEPPLGALTRAAAGDPFPARVVVGAELRRFAGGIAVPTDATATGSPEPPPGAFGL